MVFKHAEARGACVGSEVVESAFNIVNTKAALFCDTLKGLEASATGARAVFEFRCIGWEKVVLLKLDARRWLCSIGGRGVQRRPEVFGVKGIDVARVRVRFVVIGKQVKHYRQYFATRQSTGDEAEVFRGPTGYRPEVYTGLGSGTAQAK